MKVEKYLSIQYNPLTILIINKKVIRLMIILQTYKELFPPIIDKQQPLQIFYVQPKIILILWIFNRISISININFSNKSPILLQIMKLIKINLKI
jgi:hypothetical protein